MTSEHGSPDPAASRRRLLAEKERLTGLKEGLRDDLTDESESSSLGELSDADQHPADLGTETFNRERDTATLESVEGQLVDVEAALERLEAGTYGTCQACGRPIGTERLEAMPATRFCVEDSQLASVEAAPGVVPRGRQDSAGLEEPGRPI